jgi:hypothetical protein
MVRSPSFQSFLFHYAENERVAIALARIDIAPRIAVAQVKLQIREDEHPDSDRERLSILNVRN